MGLPEQIFVSWCIFDISGQYLTYKCELRHGSFQGKNPDFRSLGWIRLFVRTQSNLAAGMDVQMSEAKKMSDVTVKPVTGVVEPKPLHGR
ncbi:MAG TPA: hypothetical protein VGS99_07560, partial [Gammaproteobacteria bacterium]|nr:hypothetical protein [Gammaproteobacteria bacterium]